MRRPDGPRVAYVISEYPIVSHTFIQREIEAVEAAGVDVLPVAMAPAPPHEIVSSGASRAAATTHTIRPVRAGTLLKAVLLPTLRRPGPHLRGFLRALGQGAPGLRNRVWRAFYFVEALLLRHYCRSEGVRHIHAHHANVSAEIARMAAETGRDLGEDWSWSFTMHGCTEFYDLIHYDLADKARAADFVAAVSDYTRVQLWRILDRPHWDDIHVIHCGVETDAFVPRTASPADGRLRVLFVGRLVPEKGLPVLLDAIASLAARRDDVALTIVGDGPLRADLERRVDAEELPVTFTGTISEDEMPGVFVDHDLFVMTSFGEGLPVVLMEALACELAVVAPGISGIPELVIDDETGRLVPPGRPEELAAVIAELADDPTERARLGAAGRALVQSQFESRLEGARLAHLFADLLGDVPEMERSR